MENLQNQIQWILQEKYNGKMTVAAKKDIERLKSGEPIDHIIGFTDFLGCKILVNKDVLIPRVETEFWVEKAIEGLCPNFQSFGNQDIGVLDMFAGSGCIGIAILKHVKNSHVTFVESEKEAVKQIEMNLKCLKPNIKQSRYEIVQSDIFENVGIQKFDYIFANPPYIPLKQKPKIQKSVINYEPHVALFGGDDGMAFIRRFLASAKNRLNHGGKIYMEFDSPQKPAIEKMLKKLAYKKWQFCKDQYEKFRYMVIEY